MSGPLALCFGVHNHQPIGNFDEVLREATTLAYHPFLDRLAARPEVRLTVHCTGSLLVWLREHAPATFDLLGTLVAARQVELLTGGFYEPILAILPDPDKRGQIARLTEYLRAEFGVRPRGMWLAERVWEPQLPRILQAAGVEYVLVDDRHFALAGLEPEALGGYYLTEEQGATVGVFPINERLRHLVPFADVEKSLEYLGERRHLSAVTVVDDGEKFGAWPGTHRHVYENRWLDTFFDRVLATPWLRFATFAEVVDATPPVGRVYLPTASYQEMEEWALPPAAATALEAAKRDVGALDGAKRLTTLLRGGFWRNFLVKYPEVADLYWKMVRLSRAAEAARARHGSDARLDQVRESLWRGQANDAYWHGVFGGCYLPHLRRAVKSALLDAEVRLAALTGDVAATLVEDVNGDGRGEVVVRTPALAVTLNPTRGGTITELAVLGRRHDLADVLTRRPEPYHALLDTAAGGDVGLRSVHQPPPVKEAGLELLLAYDDFRRASLLDGLFPLDGALDPVAPWPQSRAALGETPLSRTVEAAPDGATVSLALTGETLALDKRVTVRGAALAARYRVRRPDGGPLEGRWGVQWNLALTAGSGPGRYLDLPDRPSLASTGRLPDAVGVTLVDEWLGLEARLTWSSGAELAWGPVETVSVSESGYERIYQGLALLLAWPLSAQGDEMETTLTVVER